MEEPGTFPLWLLPLFPLFFAGTWMFVTAIISLAGWNGLAERFRRPADAPPPNAREFGAASLDITGMIPLPANYNGVAVVGLGDAGVYLRTWRLFRFMHPPLLIPWAQIEECRAGRVLFMQAAVLRIRGSRTRIRIYGRPGQAVLEAWERYRAWAERGVPI